MVMQCLEKQSGGLFFAAVSPRRGSGARKRRGRIRQQHMTRTGQKCTGVL